MQFRTAQRSAHQCFRAIVMTLGLVLGSLTGLIVTSAPAAAATGNILPPFSIGETWSVCEGYNYGTHTGTSAYGLDLVKNGSGACDTSSAGATVKAPMSGTVYYYQASYGNLCVNIAGGRSYTLTHITSSITSGSVTAGQTVGTVGAAGMYNNNGVAHIHFQMWSSSGCYNSSVMPFDTADGARICGAPDMTSSGPSGGNGTWSGTAFTGQDCGASTPLDSDGDGVANTSDRCPNFAGASSNRGCRFDDHTVSGNFAGNDGYTDSLTFYDYGSGNLGAFVSQGSANGLGQPQLLWTTGTNQWSWGASSFYAGNFAGNDNYTDVIALYDYGNGQLGAFLFQGNGNGVGQAQHLWTTSTDTWARGHARYVVGNFAGNDGKDDILAFYGYGDDSTGVFVLAGNGSGVDQPTHEWSTGSNQWDAQNAEYMAGDFAGNDGYTDVIAFYQYAGNSMGAFLYQGSASGLGQAQLLWTTPQQSWNVAAGRYFVGDFAGGDNIPDVLALYNLGSGNTGSYVFQGNGSGVDQVQSLWTTGANQWSMPNAKAVAGNFGGSHTSLFAWYNYGSTTGGALFPTASPTNGVALPTIKWTTAAGQWAWSAM